MFKNKIMYQTFVLLLFNNIFLKKYKICNLLYTQIININRQIDQTRPLLETYSQKGVVLKLFPGGSVSGGDSPMELASWTRGGTWWTRQWSWRVAVHVAGLAIRTGEMLFYGIFF